MPIRFKVIEKGEPGVPGGGVKKFYATQVLMGELNFDDLTTLIEKVCTVHGADIRAVLYALVDVSLRELANSEAIRMQDLGSIRINISSEGVSTPEEVDANCITDSKFIFVPGKRLKELLENLTFEKVE